MKMQQLQLDSFPPWSNITLAPTSAVNVSKVLHRSPFRYPGGKTWLVPYTRLWLQSFRVAPTNFVESFAGGAIVGLSALFDGLTSHLTLAELDEDVASVWRTILGPQAKRFALEIEQFVPTRDSVQALLEVPARTVYQKAFATIVRNRVQRGGILAPGASLMKNGENGRGLTSRWYPQTLSKRFLDIYAQRRKIKFIHGDGLSLLEDLKLSQDIAFFIDPPYTVAGRRLYKHSQIDHSQIFRVASELQSPFLMTYDDVPQVRSLTEQHGFETARVAMKSGHHAIMSELLISRDMSWLNNKLHSL